MGIRRPPGVRTGPYPDIEIIVTATLDQLAHAHALAATRSPAQPPPRHPLDALDALDALDGFGGLDGLGGFKAADRRRGGPHSAHSAGPDGFAHAQHGGPIHPTTLALLACSGRIRRALLDPHGAVLHLGRSHRLATPAQKQALYARDIGCVIPGCTTPGDLCEIHHVTPWADDGPTNIDNLVFVCPRHHVEVTDSGGWEIHMINGVPWARPPAWAHPDRPLLRNATHRPPAPAASLEAG